MSSSSSSTQPHDSAVKGAVIGAAVTLLLSPLTMFVGPFVTPLAQGLSDSTLGPQVEFNTCEVLLRNGRVLLVPCSNEGHSPAEGVTLSIDAAALHRDVSFLKEHIHTIPTMPIEVSASGTRIQVKLGTPLGPKQSVLLIADEIAIPGIIPLLLGSVSHAKGKGLDLGPRVLHHPDLTLDEFIARNSR